MPCTRHPAYGLLHSVGSPTVSLPLSPLLSPLLHTSSTCAVRLPILPALLLCPPPPPQDELLSTELLFRGLLTGMSPEEAVALMSALVFQVRGVTTDPTVQTG